jgi:hypothetical protein
LKFENVVNMVKKMNYQIICNVCNQGNLVENL